jgi:hypothetical protein
MDSKSHNGFRINGVKYGDKTKQAFEWWGPAPQTARKIAVSKSKALVDKRVSLKAAVKRYLRDAITIGIGGFVNTRVPVAIIHEIIRQLNYWREPCCCIPIMFLSNGRNWHGGAMK